MLRFPNTKSSMLYNLLSVDEAQMFIFEASLEKKQFNMSVPVNMSVHFYTGTGCAAQNFVQSIMRSLAFPPAQKIVAPLWH